MSSLDFPFSVCDPRPRGKRRPKTGQRVTDKPLAAAERAAFAGSGLHPSRCTVCGHNCQVHHALADWKNGGHTNIDDLTLGCGPDNRMIEKTGWRTRKRNDGRTEWLPPPTSTGGTTRLRGTANDASTDTITPSDTYSPKTTKVYESCC